MYREAFTGVNNIHKAVNATRTSRGQKTVTLKQVKHELSTIPAYVLFAAKKRVRHTLPTLSPSLNFYWQMDLLSMQPISETRTGAALSTSTVGHDRDDDDEESDHSTAHLAAVDSSRGERYTFILTTIDIFSRRGYARPLLSKRASDVARALADIFLEAGATPSNIYMDNGSEWKGDTAALLKKHKVGVFIGRGPNKAAVIERWNKTLLQRLYKFMAFKHTRRWAPLLPTVVKNYNSSPHTTLGRAPNSITFDNQASFYKAYYHPKYKRLSSGAAKADFKVGDQVVLKHDKSFPLRGYDQQFGYEHFTVHRVYRTTPVRYAVRDQKNSVLPRRYMAGELALVRWGTSQSDYHDLEILGRRVGVDGNEEVKVHYLADPKSVTHWLPRKQLKNIQR